MELRLTLSNYLGTLMHNKTFQAWGNRRDPATWNVYTTLPTGILLARGFTGHEHLDLFGLINMDGRVYDPVIGRFLSADPVIQDIENLQCFNRYSYCVNNPLSLIDPSGYSWLSNNWRSLVAAAVAITATIITAGALAPLGWSALATATVAGAAGGFAGGFTGALLNGGNLGDAFKAGAIGGLIGGASGFLSFAAGSVSSTGTWAIVERAVKHTFADAWLAGIQGENMMHGALSGMFSSLGGEVTQELEPLGAKVAANAIVGGTASMVGGGKFANGAITGAYVMMFNHMMPHENDGQSIKATNLQLKSKFTVEDLLRAMLEKMKDGDYITGDELGTLKGFENASKINRITRVAGGFKVNMGLLARAALALIPSAPSIKNNSIFTVKGIIWVDNKTPVLHVVNPDASFLRYDKVIPCNIYLHNNGYTPFYDNASIKLGITKDGEW